MLPPPTHPHGTAIHTAGVGTAPRANGVLHFTPMDLSNVKRPENLVPGDRIKVWDTDLTVESAEPSLDQLSVRVHVATASGDTSTLAYLPGTLVEVAGSED